MTFFSNRSLILLFLFIFFILFTLTVYSLISSNEIVRNAELIQYVVILDLSYLIFLSCFLFISLFKIYKTRKKEIIGLRLFYKFFLFFSIFSIIPSTIILISSLIFFNIEVSTWLGPAFKSTVNNSYLIANKYIKEREDNLITDTNFIKNYILAERDIDPSIIKRFDIETVYLSKQDQLNKVYSSDNEIEIKNINRDLIFEEHLSDLNVFFNEGQFFSKAKITNDTDLILIKKIDLDLLKFYQNIIKSYNAYQDIDNNKKNLQITFFTIFFIISSSIILIFLIIGYKFSVNLANPIRDLSINIHNLKSGKTVAITSKTLDKKDDISILSNSFDSMREKILSQKNSLIQKNKEILDNMPKLINSEKNKALADLAKKISHEIKNPLTPMLLSSEYIEKKIKGHELESDILNSTNSIKRQIFLIQNLINEFSSFARMPKPKIVMLNISEILNIYYDEYTKNYNLITFTKDIDDDIFLNFDQSYFDLVLNNLFKNSIEAGKNTNNLKINIALKKVDNNIVFHFTDNGPGFDGDINQLTQPYFSTKNSTGLGLSLVHKIISDNGAHFKIKTSKDNGFEVSITFNA
ncbi:ATP-binding protein [Alphaproteobacteria bacterium]|nr:ATP-binding protein [Alphaproteobacteria bacterium]